MRILLPPVLAVLVAPALASCSLLGGGPLDDALDVLPADATGVVFRDRAALAERLGVADPDRDDEQALAEYAEAMTGSGAPAGDLLTEFVVGMQETGFSDLDVVWSATATVEAGPFTVYDVDEDVDLDAVADDLADEGWAEDDLRGRRHLVLDGAPPPTYPSNWVEVTVDPEEHLVVVGAADDVLRVVDEEGESLTDVDTFDGVLDGADDVEYAVLASPPRCDLPPDDAAGLGRPDATAYLLAGDDAEPAARLDLGDDDAAEADLDARRDHLEGHGGGDSFDLERDGSVVRVAMDLADVATGARDAQQGARFLACPGEAR